jgi:protein-S-isoprenylcysteine O-methyltransferase Ste14
MSIVALWSVFGVITFGVRTLVQLRVTGRTGWVFHRSVRPLDRFARAVFASSLAIGFASAVLAVFVPEHPLWKVWAIPAGVRTAALAVVALGVALTFAAQLAMGKSWRIGVDAAEHTELVAHGLFRFVRNPIYSAMLVTVAGLTLLNCSWLSGGALVALIAALEVQVRAVEEPYLARTHGRAYREYASRVGRFVPLLGLRLHPSTAELSRADRDRLA